MTEADLPRRAGAVRPGEVRLHLHRGIGWGLYGTAAVFVFVLVLIGTTAYVSSGRFVMAAVTALVGLALTAFLVVVTLAVVVPALTVSAAGISGRMPRGRRVAAGWDEITVDVDDDRPDQVRLDVGGESVSVGARSWVGFTDFVVLVAGTPHALDRLTPAAVQKWMRMLGVTDEEPT